MVDFFLNVAQFTEFLQGILPQKPMVAFFMDIAQFILQTAILLVALLILIGFIFSLVNKNKEDISGLEVKDLNKKLNKNRQTLQKALLDKKAFKKLKKSEKVKTKKEEQKQRVFVLNFKGDIKATAVSELRSEISAILGVITDQDQVVLKLESPGGVVHGYGLAASQLQRIRDRGISLTVCVDKIAASGGYMMASIANHIISAPYAIIGSIGVAASMPNLNKLLKKNDIEYLEITAGQYKRTLTPLGEITEPGMKKFKEQIEDVHVLFKDHVKNQRKQVDIEQVATGEYWYGLRAKELNLVDEIGTSDDYLLKLNETCSIFEVSMGRKRSLKEKLMENMALQVERLFDFIEDRIWKSRFSC